jgi:hypothetical protein
MERAPISPWADAADCASPDGRYRATISEASEIAMGAPTSGTLIVVDTHHDGRVRATLDSCNPSLVWSSDSRALAVPRWTSTRMQRLCIVSLPSGAIRVSAGEFRVLELHDFDNGTVRGVDSPVHMPRSVELSIED